MQHFSLMLLSNNLMCCLNINQFPVVKLQLITSVDNGWNNSIMAREQITSPATILITSSQGTFHAEKVFNKKTYEHYFLNYKQPWIFFLFLFFSPNNKEGGGVLEQLLYISQNLIYFIILKRHPRWFCICITVSTNIILNVHISLNALTHPWKSSNIIFSIMSTEQCWSCLFQEFNALFTSRMLIKADCSFTND